MTATWRFEAIGTTWEVVTQRRLPEAVRSRVAREIGEFDRTWSRFRPDSLVHGLADGGTAPLPPDAAAMLDAFVALSDATDGAVNPLVGAALAHRGYDARYSLTDHGALPAPERWTDVLTWNARMLELRAPAVIDVGALGKGRLVDLVLGLVSEEAPGDVVVDASGDLAVRGRPHRIGLEHPFHPTRAIGVWEIADAALCASAVNRRSWPAATEGGLHHVLDARTGEPVRAIAATWAVAGDAMTADAIATALFFDGGPRLAHDWGAQWVRMRSDGRVEWSPGCRADLFTGPDNVEP